mmetsp:Transcript_29730/g.55287  ORF Transcript_29730/g.55287 Transcript_29730/m.55287 type:complete len:84 (-) Transcript_29730:103-354(-)
MKPPQQQKEYDGGHMRTTHMQRQTNTPSQQGTSDLNYGSSVREGIDGPTNRNSKENTKNLPKGGTGEVNNSPPHDIKQPDIQT